MGRLTTNESAITAQDRSLAIFSVTPGLDLNRTSGGTLASYKDPLRLRWVFVIGFDGNVVLCKEGRRGASGWSVGTTNHSIIRANFPNGYTVEHFTFFQIGMRRNPETGELEDDPDWDGQPAATDLMCKIEGGLIVPDYRMLLVEPAAVEDLCEPCEPAETVAVDPPAGEDCGCDS